MYVVTASDGSPAFPPGMQKRDLRRNQSDLTFNTYIMSFICYAMYLPLVIVAMGMGMERWRRKVQMFAAEQVGELRSYLAQKA